MRINSVLAATALAGSLTAGLVGVALPAGAAPARPAATHSASAKADWKKGAKVVAAEKNHYLAAAGRQLAAYGRKYAHERSDLTALTRIPLTGTTAKQRATAVRDTRELNGFFGTPGLYGVKAGNAKTIAKADWVKSAHVAAASRKTWLAGTIDELDSYGKRYAKQRSALASLESIPLTSTTARQRATARKDVRALDSFFKTPGLNG